MTEQSAGLRRRLARARRAMFVPRSVTSEQERTSKQLARQGRQLKQVVTRLSDIHEQLRPLTIASNHRDAEHEVLTAQMGALEERMGRIEERLGTGRFVADDDEQAEARRLVEEIRAQHEQIRVRMQIVSHYEERLRRLEATVQSLSGLTEDGARHPV
jgi:chromosome segregation ATPase